MSRLLVTGATGFVGRHFVRRAVSQGHEVTAVTRSDAAVAGARILPVGSLESANWDRQLGGFDAIVHIAARVHQMHDTAIDPLAAFRATNTEATLALARAAGAQGVRRFVFLSSVKAAVDGGGRDPIGDDVTPGPKTPYGLSKREAEIGLAKIDGLDTVILRPPLVYGPGAKGNILSFYRLARTGLPLPFGNIQNLRSLIGVTNLADVILHALAIPVSANPAYFVEDTRVSTAQLCQRVAASLERRAILLPAPVGLMRLGARVVAQSAAIERLTESLVVDSSRFRETGWRPSVPMAHELESLARCLYP